MELIELILQVLAWALIVTGSLFAVVGGIGLLRLPDFFSRMHAAGITDTLGAGLILIGLMLMGGLSLVTVKLLMILALLLLTSPTSGHALAQAALAYGLRPWAGEETGAAVGEADQDQDANAAGTGEEDESSST